MDAGLQAANVRGPAPWWKAFLVRTALVVAITFVITTVLNRSATRRGEGADVAGFAQGLVHGALMPAALPSLLAGRDVSIYAQSNNGRPYKLGYTTGVNACGAAFFGLLYRRLVSWARRRSATKDVAG